MSGDLSFIGTGLCILISGKVYMFGQVGVRRVFIYVHLSLEGEGLSLFSARSVYLFLWESSVIPGEKILHGCPARKGLFIYPARGGSSSILGNCFSGPCFVLGRGHLCIQPHGTPAM
jgi:hypothetical protein